MRDAGDVNNVTVAKRMRSTKSFVYHVTNSLNNIHTQVIWKKL